MKDNINNSENEYSKKPEKNEIQTDEKMQRSSEPDNNTKKALEKSSGYRLIKRRRKSVLMPEAKYDRAFDKENPYYIKIANKFRIIKYLTILITVVFAMTMLTKFSSDITAENFQYLIKDLDITGLTGDRTFGQIIYSGDSSSSFGIYRGELVVVNSGTTMLYKPSGALSLQISSDFYNPRLAVSNKYFMVFDRGETSCSYSIYNSFAELKNESFEYPITLGAISDEGSYAVVTRDDSFRSIVYYYDKNFKPINLIKKDKYITALAFTSDGNMLAIASAYDNGGNFEAEIQVIKGNSANAEFTLVETGLLPLGAKWLSNGNLCILYSERVCIYSPKGERLSYIDLSGHQSLSFALGDERLVSVYNSTVLGYDNTVDIYDKNADKKYSFGFEGDVISLKTENNIVCILFEDRVVKIDSTKGTVQVADVEPNAKDIVFYEDTVLVCYSGGASPAVFRADSN